MRKGICISSRVVRFGALAVIVIGAATIVTVLPDVKRYLRLRRM